MILLVFRLFLEMKPEHLGKRKMLPLKHQQTAFETVYLKAQEGMRLPVSSLFVVLYPREFIMCVFSASV